MIQVKEISKEYKTGEFVQKALDEVSLSFRDNEFVAVLGPSGSGKTTLLNIVGGLDRYDSGNLIINGTSTKEYKDRDWDAYRNHSVGFIFQSYNLIPHQTVLANVELALTIAGISKAERTKRATEALERVGLGEHINKKPSQLSGGQMQRVAIARALINEPTILLADEPTGALDSETSVSVMELLKDVAKDRLVVMVTHNPELAETYANRIVELKDGHVVGDSNPFTPEEVETDNKSFGKASMSFLTALGLSFSNLRTKLRRTLLVAFAGSIGIIGIALILSLSNGMNRYMDNIQRDTLSEYPVDIYRNSFDLSVFDTDTTATVERPKGEITEFQMAATMFSTVSNNDLRSFMAHIEKNKKELEKYTQNIEYRYNISPFIFTEKDGKIRQAHPNDSFSSISMLSGGMMSASGYMDVFSQLPDNENFYKKGYDIKAGRWPEKYNELVLVLSTEGWISDMTLYQIGLKDASKLDAMIETFMTGGQVEIKEKSGAYNYKDFIGLPFKLVDRSQLFVYDDDLGIWTDKSNDSSLLKDLVAEGEKLEIVGVALAKEDSTIEVLDSGVYFTPELTKHVIDLAKDSGVVKDQLANPKVNVLTGKDFGDTENGGMPDLASLFSINESALASAFQIDPSYNVPTPSDEEIAKLLEGVEIDTSPETAGKVLREVFTSYLEYAAKDPSTDYQNLPAAMQAYLATDAATDAISDELTEIVNGLLTNVWTSERLNQMVTHIMSGYNPMSGISIEDYLQTEAAQAALGQEVAAMSTDIAAAILQDEHAQVMVQKLAEGYEEYAKSNGTPQMSLFSDSFGEYLRTQSGRAMVNNAVSQIVDTSNADSSSAINEMLPGIMEDFMENAFSFNADAFANAFAMKLDPEDMRDMILSFFNGGSATYNDNLSQFGYADLADPDEIIIYPKNFENKADVVNFIDKYNAKMLKDGHEEKVIRHADMVGTIMSSVTKIINAVSYVLVAFVAVSLIVSSIMIGVITYISVLERNKEIGILRAIGASKRNISSVFNAETFIIGALSGLIGIGLSELILLPGNHLIHSLTNQPDLSAYLPIHIAAALVVLSIVLTLLGGFIPSKAAARRDPVAALRTE